MVINNNSGLRIFRGIHLSKVADSHIKPRLGLVAIDDGADVNVSNDDFEVDDPYARGDIIKFPMKNVSVVNDIKYDADDSYPIVADNNGIFIETKLNEIEGF